MHLPLLKSLSAGQHAPGRRTLPVTFVCIAYLLGMVYILWHLMTMSDEDSEMLSLILIPCVMGVSGLVYGLWKMKRWAASSFITFSLVGIFRAIYPFDHFNLYFLLLNLAVLVILAVQRKKMV